MGCAQCVTQSGVYYYGTGRGTFGEYTGNSSGGKCCTSTADTDCTGTAQYKNGPNSSIFTEKEYAINACPNKTDVCGDRTVLLRDTKATAVEKTITKLTFQDSCHYMVKTFCGAPQAQLKTATNVVGKVSINILEWAPDGVKDYGPAKVAAQALERGKKFKAPDGESSPLLTQEFTATKTDEHKLNGGTIPLLGTDNVTKVTAAVAAQRALIATYKADLAKYFTAYQSYADSFIAILKENFNDYGMNIVRTAADNNLYKKNLTAAAVSPAEPKAYAGKYLKTDATSGLLSPAWEGGAGTPYKTSFVMDKTYGIAGALRNFGAFGQSKTGTPYYSNWRSELWHYGMNNDAAAANAYGASICSPKYMFVNVVYTNNAETESTNA